MNNLSYSSNMCELQMLKYAKPQFESVTHIKYMMSIREAEATK